MRRICSHSLTPRPIGWMSPSSSSSVRSLVTRSLAIPVTVQPTDAHAAPLAAPPESSAYHLLLHWSSLNKSRVSVTMLATDRQAGEAISAATATAGQYLSWPEPNACDESQELPPGQGELSQTIDMAHSQDFLVEHRSLHLSSYEVANLLCVLEGSLAGVTLERKYFRLQMHRGGEDEGQGASITIVGDLFKRQQSSSSSSPQPQAVDGGEDASALWSPHATFTAHLDVGWNRLLATHLNSCLSEIFGIENYFFKKRSTLRDRAVLRDAGLRARPPQLQQQHQAERASPLQQKPSSRGTAQATPTTPTRRAGPVMQRSPTADLGYHNASRRELSQGRGVYASQLQQQEVEEFSKRSASPLSSPSIIAEKSEGSVGPDRRHAADSLLASLQQATDSARRSPLQPLQRHARQTTVAPSSAVLTGPLVLGAELLEDDGTVTSPPSNVLSSSAPATNSPPVVLREAQQQQQRLWDDNSLEEDLGNSLSTTAATTTATSVTDKNLFSALEEPEEDEVPVAVAQQTPAKRSKKQTSDPAHSVAATTTKGTKQTTVSSKTTKPKKSSQIQNEWEKLLIKNTNSLSSSSSKKKQSSTGTTATKKSSARSTKKPIDEDSNFEDL